MKVGIVGTGYVGATAAYALIMSGVGREVVLVDLNVQRAQAEADDLFHAVPFAHPLQVRAGGYSDLAGCRVVIIGAGVGQKPGETRLQLLERNAAVFRSIIPAVLEHAPQAVLLIATNPVDVMTHLAARYAAELGIPSQRVIGSGTTLDTARFRVLLSEQLQVDPQHIHAYVLGEHGDSEVLAWSQVSVGGLPLDDFCHAREVALDEAARQAIDDRVRNAAYHIIAGKGATYYGIGAALARIVDAIVQDQRAIFTVCTPLPELMGVRDVTVALPHLLGGDGVLDTFPPRLNAREAAALRAGAQKIRAVIDQLGGL